MTYSLDNIPEGTTYVWLPAITTPTLPGFERLAFYKKTYYKKGGKYLWKVYSKHTGWRLSQHPPEWYTKERTAGFFVTLKHAVKKELDNDL